MDSQPHPNPLVRRLFPPLATLDAGGMPVECPVSIAVLSKNEERCIARCLDSVVGRGFDDIVVVDTGSVDRTLNIVEEYRQRGVRLLQVPWTNSFADARNFAIETVKTGWIVFLDADEWLGERSRDQLADCLASLSGVKHLDRLVFSPVIRHMERDEITDDVPRIFKADSEIRYRGAVHEYPVVGRFLDEPVGMVGLDIWFRHDGYDPMVANTKNKRERNLALLHTAREEDPDNPRWLYFTVRDGLPTFDRTQLVELCGKLRGLVDKDTATGDRRKAYEYYRLALCEACQGLAVIGDWHTVLRYCDELDRIDQRDSPDAHYLRSIAKLVGGMATDRDLLRTMGLRRDDEVVATSAIDGSGRHLDALIVALLAQCRSKADADRYRELCSSWTDVFFEHSHLRQWSAAGLS